MGGKSSYIKQVRIYNSKPAIAYPFFVSFKELSMKHNKVKYDWWDETS